MQLRWRGGGYGTKTGVRDGRRERSDLFMPGRTTFQFVLEDQPGTDVPTTVLRSKADLVSTV
jgi:hypothetical protein